MLVQVRAGIIRLDKPTASDRQEAVNSTWMTECTNRPERRQSA